MPHIKRRFLGRKSTPEARVADYTDGVAEIVLANGDQQMTDVRNALHSQHTLPESH